MSEEMSHHSEESVRETISDIHEKTASNFTKKVALSTMILAMITAIAALLAGMSANDILVKRTHEILEVSHKETDRVIFELLDLKQALLGSHQENSPGIPHSEPLDKMGRDADQLSREVNTEEKKVAFDAELHEIFAISVTVLSLAITLGGIAMIVERKRYWYYSLGFAIIGSTIFTYGLFRFL